MKKLTRILFLILLANSAFSQLENRTKEKIHYGLTVYGAGIFTFEKNADLYKNGIDNYPLFYGLGFYLSKKKHTFEIGAYNQIVNRDPSSFYYLLAYSYKITKENTPLNIFASVKTLSNIYQYKAYEKNVKQYTCDDLIIGIGPTVSKNVNRVSFNFGLYYITGLLTCIKQYSNGHRTIINTEKPAFTASFLAELKIMLKLN